MANKKSANYDTGSKSVEPASDGSLSTGSERPRVQLVAPSAPKLFVRGATRRCPWCGDRKAYFTGWVKRDESCRECGRGFRRGDDAFELGAVTINIILTFLSILISMVVAFTVVGVTGAEVPVVPIILIGVFWALLGPLIYYPVSFTLWQSIDLFMRHPTPTELAGGEDDKL